MGVLLPAVLLLAGGEGAVHPGFQQNFLGLQGQEPQGSQVDPRGGGLEPLEPGISLAGVGAPDVEDEPAGHGTGLGVLILRVQGHEDFQAGADGPGDKDHGIQVAQGPGEELLFGKVLHGQQGVEVSFGLGGGEVADGLGSGGVQDLDVTGLHLPHEGAGEILPHPHPRLDEVGQVGGELVRVAPALQGEELVEKGRGLVGPDGPSLGGGGQLVGDDLVVVLRQNPGGLVPFLGGLPEGIQGVGHGLGGLPGPFGGLAGGLGGPGFLLEEVGLLGLPHVVPVPHGGGAAVDPAVPGLGQELVDEFVGPAPGFQQGGGPELPLRVVCHADPPFVGGVFR